MIVDSRHGLFNRLDYDAMVTSITPIIQQYTPRAHSRVGDRSAYTPTNQLSAIDYANAPDQSFTYDLNGNRTGSGNVTGADNRLTSNATWDFVYDANGNMTRRTLKSDNSYIEYTYDHRDRLTDVRYRNSAGTLTKRVHFGYDALNRRYLQTVENGSGTILLTVYYVNQGFRKDRGDAGDEIALRLDGTGAVISRYLHGSMVDEVLAEENIGSGGVRDVLWAMTDHQGSVRDLARVTSGTASVVNHIVYDAFGKTVSETDTAIAHLYGYTGRELDKETGLQYNRARYLDLALARWISQDPIGFEAGDANLYRYVGNGPADATDPSGLIVRGDGHHILPWSIFIDAGFSEAVTEHFNSDSARLRDDLYKSHNGARVRGISETEYRAEVQKIYDKFMTGKSAKDLTPKEAKKLIDKIRCSENTIVKNYLDGVQAEINLAKETAEAYIRKAQRRGRALDEALWREARDHADEIVKLTRKEITARVLSKVTSNRAAKGVLGFIDFYTIASDGNVTGAEVSRACADITPLGWSLMAGEALGEATEYLQDEIERTAEINRTSERWWMGPAHSRPTYNDDKR